MSFFPTLKDYPVESLQLELALFDKVVLLMRERDNFSLFVKLRHLSHILFHAWSKHRLLRGHYEVIFGVY